MTALTPDLHALIEEAWDRARRRRWTYAAVLALLLAGAGIWGGLALTSGSRSIPAPPAPPGYHLVRAQGPVQHALVADPSLAMVNGRSLGKVRLEFWFDPKSGLMRERGSWGSIRVPDTATRCPCPAFNDGTDTNPHGPKILFERYWPVDTAQFVRRPGIGTFHGRKVIWLGRISKTFSPPSYGNGEWIALDPRTHDPVAWRRFAITTKPTGPIIDEIWVLKRFRDIPASRFWFALKNPPSAR